MKKKMLLATVLCALFVLCGCMAEDDVPVYDETAVPPETREELYSYYNQIERDMTRAQVEELFGKGLIRYDEDGIEMYSIYCNEKKSAGVNIIYRPNDTVYSKILYYNKAADLVPFSNEYIESKIPDIEDGGALAVAEELFGAGLELVCTYNETNASQDAKIFSWFNADGTNFQIHATNGVVTSRVLNRPGK